MWAKVLAWAIKIGGAVYRWVVANKSLILKWIGWGWTFIEITIEIIQRAF
ncbi:MAG: hypothetical protein Q8M66_07990 [Actinomycetota bacterium]|jgi:hypothetical protein|nr:hypothetical protein [Actinomycetota bacterium]MDZ4179823.1 hypothetical protein [Coriobacteriia bacterium]